MKMWFFVQKIQISVSKKPLLKTTKKCGFSIKNDQNWFSKWFLKVVLEKN
jgi:hypothetical protein